MFAKEEAAVKLVLLLLLAAVVVVVELPYSVAEAVAIPCLPEEVVEVDSLWHLPSVPEEVAAALVVVEDRLYRHRHP